MALASLTIDLVARLSQFETDLGRVAHVAEDAGNRMKQAFAGLTDLLGVLGVGVGLAAFSESIKGAIDSTLELGRVSEKTGIALEALSGLKLAASTVGLQFEDLSISLEKFNRSIDNGSKSFVRLGISLRDSSGQAKTTESLLGEVADKFAAMQDGAGKTAIAMDLFSRSGARLIPFLNEGSAGMTEFVTQAHQLGTAIDEKAIASAREFEKELALLKGAAEGFKLAIAQSLLPALIQITTAAVEAAKEHGLLLGILKGYAQLGKITIFGRDDEVRNQVRFVSDLRAELGGLLATLQDRSQQGKAGAFLGGLLGQDTPEQIKIKIASVTQQLKDAQATLDNLVNKSVTKPALAPAPPPVDTDISALIKVQLSNIVAMEKLTASERLTILEDFNARGLIGVRDYYAARVTIAESELRAELAAVKNAIGQQQKALADAPQAQRGQAQVEMTRLLGEQARLQVQANFVQVQGAQQLIDKQQQLDDIVTHVNEQFDRQQHNTAAAAAAQFDVANRVLSARLTTEFGADSPEMQRLRAVRDTSVAQAELNDLSTEANSIREREAAVEQNITSALQAAGLSPENELAAERAINQAREESLPRLREIAKSQLEIAITRGTTVDVANALKYNAAVNATAASTSAAAVALQQFAIQQKQLSIITGDEAIAEKNIASARAASAITDLDALQATDQARRDAIGPLTKMADEMERAAIASKDPSALLAVRQLRADITALAASAHSAADVFRNVFETSFVTAFDSFAQGAQNAGQAFRSFALDVVRGLEHIAAQQFAQILFGSSGVGGTGLFSLLAGLFSGGAGAGSASFAGRMAIGGITSGPTLAGEAGPEAVIPLSGGRAVPVELKGGGGGPVTVNVTVHAGGAITGGPNASDQLGVAIAAAVQRELITQKQPGGLLARV